MRSPHNLCNFVEGSFQQYIEMNKRFSFNISDIFRIKETEAHAFQLWCSSKRGNTTSSVQVFVISVKHVFNWPILLQIWNKISLLLSNWSQKVKLPVKSVIKTVDHFQEGTIWMPLILNILGKLVCLLFPWLLLFWTGACSFDKKYEFLSKKKILDTHFF